MRAQRRMNKGCKFNMKSQKQQMLFITDKLGNSIEVTDLKAAVHQVTIYLRKLDRNRKPEKYNQADKEYYSDILNKLRALKNNNAQL